jgi:anti-sigma regulatory factor (Ser/Thr protein kinase)
LTVNLETVERNKALSSIPQTADILLIDTDPGRRQLLETMVRGYCPCEASGDLEDAGKSSARYVLLSSTPDNSRTIVDFEKLKMYREPEQIGIISTYSSDPQMAALFRAGASQFLSGSGGRLEHDLGWQLKAFVDRTPQLDLGRMFGPLQDTRSFIVRDRWERQSAAEQVVDFFTNAEFADAIVDIQLAMDELLNNSLYHSFRDVDGQEKYTPETFDALQSDQEQVRVDIGRSADFHIMRVSDTAGSLEVEVVKQSLSRHMKMQGLLDEHGRGFFLMRSVSDGMLLRIAPGKLTEVTLVFGRHLNALVKSLFIQTI